MYLGDEKMIQEYVMNDTGRIYTGSKKQISHKPWVFGQFESCILDVALYLLEISQLPIHVRGNPIPVIRKISAAVSTELRDLGPTWVRFAQNGTNPGLF